MAPQRKETHGVSGQHGDQDGLRRGQDRNTSRTLCRRGGYDYWRSKCSWMDYRGILTRDGDLRKCREQFPFLPDVSVREALKLPGCGSKWQCRLFGMFRRNGRRKKMGVHIDTFHGECYQICSFIWADWWILSHSQTHLEQMTKDLIGGSRKMGLVTSTSTSVVDKHLC